MSFSPTAFRRTVAGAAVAAAAILVPAIALAAPGSAGSASAPTATYPRCTRGALTGWLGVPGSGAAGSIYYQLELSNTSRSTCTLYGYPGVSAVNGSRQLGSAAGRTRSHLPRLVVLRPGWTAHVILQITDVGDFAPAACHPVTAHALRVYPPGAFRSLLVPFTFHACARRGPVYLHVTTTTAGTGIPGHSS